MKTCIRSVLLLLVCIALFGPPPAAAREREAIRETGIKDQRLVRAAYAKLSAYNRAALVAQMFGENEWIADRVALTFKLRDFRTGSIDDIQRARWGDLVSFREGDVIDGTFTVTSTRDDEEVSYPATWVSGGFSTVDDPSYTVAEVFAIERQAFHDVGRYVAYEVTASLDGRSRTYRALALIHDRFNADAPAVTFMDNVIGGNGIVSHLWRETRAPLQPRAHAPAPPANERSRDGRLSVRGDDWSRLWGPWGDEKHHVGWHAAESTVYGKCTSASFDEQECLVSNWGIKLDEWGDVHGWDAMYKHVGATSAKDGLRVGPKGTNIDCAGAVGATYTECVFQCGISFSVGVDKNGAGAKATVQGGGNLWTRAMAFDNTCNIRREEGCHEGDEAACSANYSPIVLDMQGNGYALTGLADGVRFDLDRDGRAERLGWTVAGSDDAFLVLDRNGNGMIDDGGELFGDVTDQPPSKARNGFLALAEFDRPEHGGNADGVIDSRDRGFASLQLWRDVNHNGVSESDELQLLAGSSVVRLHLAFKYSRKTDAHGNELRYRAKLDDAKKSDVDRWAWDVFFVRDAS